MRGRLTTAAVIASLALAAGIAACGDDDEDTSASEETASAETVTVTTADTADGYSWEIEPAPTTETTSVEFVNESEEQHVMLMARINEGFTVEEAIQLQGEKGSAEEVLTVEGPPGEEGSGEIKKPLEPGTYAMLCPLAGQDGPHVELGQLEELEIQ